MHPIIYDVAVSLDGFICGPEGDISKFAHEGAVVDDYMARLAGYSTALMGRSTYEFGYRFGMTEGQNPYAHMKTHVFGSSLTLPKTAEVTVESTLSPERIRELQRASSGPVYLCGGGAFAGALLRLGLIDQLILKRAPILLGDGVKLFEGVQDAPTLGRRESKDYGGGYLLEKFAIER